MVRRPSLSKTGSGGLGDDLEAPREEPGQALEAFEFVLCWDCRPCEDWGLGCNVGARSRCQQCLHPLPTGTHSEGEEGGRDWEIQRVWQHFVAAEKSKGQER